MRSAPQDHRVLWRSAPRALKNWLIDSALMVATPTSRCSRYARLLLIFGDGPTQGKAPFGLKRLAVLANRAG
ncbi:hypothetical protein D3C85_1744450 [compost metagenome]